LKILMIDIETAPHKVYAWGLFDQRIATNQIVEPGYTLCYAAKWYGEKGMFYDSVHQSTPKAMLKGVHALLDEADAVAHYNGTSFDIPVLIGEFMKHHMKPPSPFKQIDLIKTTRKARIASRKLDYVSQMLGLGSKTVHKGMPLWTACMDGDAAAWKIMEKYNRQDVKLLESLYDELLPWIPGHPNRNNYDETEVCPKCGGKHYQRRGYAIASTRRYARFQCKDCGSWFKSTTAEPGRVAFAEAA
jgi:DNA polymerase elongation subunit (family B)